MKPASVIANKLNSNELPPPTSSSDGGGSSPDTFSLRTHWRKSLFAVWRVRRRLLAWSDRLRLGRRTLYRQDRLAMRLAARHGLTEEYKQARRYGLTPAEALADWDIPIPVGSGYKSD